MARLDKDTEVRLAEPVESAYLGVVDRLIQNIARHFKTGKGLPTAEWQLKKLSELGALTSENAKIINAETKRVPEEIKAALNEASKIALDDIDRAIQSAIDSGAINQAPDDSTIAIIRELYAQAVDKANLVNTVMLQSSQSAYLKIIQGVVFWENLWMTAQQKNIAQSMLNESTLDVVTGTETRRQALRIAIAQMADNGIFGFVDRGGHHWSPEAYINMDIRTTVHNTAIQSIRARQESYGSDIFQVSTHPGARPLCYPYQGKFYSWGNSRGTFVDGSGTTHSYGSYRLDTSSDEPAGLFQINCGHYPLPQIPNVTIPKEEPLMDGEENSKIYKESQQQRAFERKIRDAKRKEAAYTAAGDSEAAAKMNALVNTRQSAMRDFIARTGRVRRYDRENIKG